MFYNQDKVERKKFCVAINKRAHNVVKDLKSKEAELIKILQEVDKHKVHRFCGYNSLYQYCLKALELTENQACDYIRVARKALEIPDLQKDIDQGELSVSKARRIVSVADENSYREWSHKAKTYTKRELEKAIASKSPRDSVPEHCRYVAKDLLHLQAPVTEAVFKKLQRAQEVISQKDKQWAKFNELLDTVLEVYLEKHDPERRAKRVVERRKPSAPRGPSKPQRKPKQNFSDHKVAPLITVPSAQRVDTNSVPKPAPRLANANSALHETNHLPAIKNAHPISPSGEGLNRQKIVDASGLPGPGQVKFKDLQTHKHDRPNRYIPAEVKLVVLERDQYKCQWLYHDGKLCGERKFIELHHLKPVSHGGDNTERNLTVLCSGHHRALHEEFGQHQARHKIFG